MVWDGLIVLLFLSLAVAGWSVGIVNSWRGPLALLVATLATQQFYVDFATWIVQQLRVSPDQAVAIGYILLWGAIEITCELLLGVMLPFNRKTRPMMPERVLGALLGMFKAAVVVICPLIALQGPIKVPQPPADKSALVNPIDSGIDKSTLLLKFADVAKGLAQPLGPIVISQKEPSFKPDFSGRTALDPSGDASTTTSTDTASGAATSTSTATATDTGSNPQPAKSKGKKKHR